VGPPEAPKTTGGGAGDAASGNPMFFRPLRQSCLRLFLSASSAKRLSRSFELPWASWAVGQATSWVGILRYDLSTGCRQRWRHRPRH